MVNIEEIKQYNAELKKNKEKASMLKAQLDLYEKELSTKCEELSRELGIQVTKDNIREVYAEYEKKVEQALSTGMAVLGKIAQAESQSVSSIQHANVQPQVRTETYQQQASTIQQGTVQGMNNGNIPVGATVTAGQFFQI